MWQFGLDCICFGITLVSQLKMNATLFDFPAERRPGQRGRNAKKGVRLKNFKQMLSLDGLPWKETDRSSPISYSLGFSCGSRREIGSVASDEHRSSYDARANDLVIYRSLGDGNSKAVVISSDCSVNPHTNGTI